MARLRIEDLLVIDRRAFHADIKAAYYLKYNKQYGSIRDLFAANNLSDSTIYNVKGNWDRRKEELKEYWDTTGYKDEDLGAINVRLYRATIKALKLKDVYVLPVRKKPETKEEPKTDTDKSSVKKSQDSDILKVIAENLAMQNRLLAEISETLKSMDQSWKASPTQRRRPKAYISYQDISVSDTEDKKEVVG